MKINSTLSVILIALMGTMVNSSIFAQVKGIVTEVENQSEKNIRVRKQQANKAEKFIELGTLYPNKTLSLGNNGLLAEGEMILVDLFAPGEVSVSEVLYYKPKSYEKVKFIVHSFKDKRCNYYVRQGGAAQGGGIAIGVPCVEIVQVP